jgi:hypothetical protein
MFELFGVLGQSGGVAVILVLFIVFLFLAYKVFKVLVKTVVIAVIAGVFPLVARYIFGMDIPVSFDSILWFVITAIALYFIYCIAHSFWKMVHMAFLGGKKEKKKAD